MAGKFAFQNWLDYNLKEIVMAIFQYANHNIQIRGAYISDWLIFGILQYYSMASAPGPQSTLFNCFPVSKSHTLMWLSNELEAATGLLHNGEGKHYNMLQNDTLRCGIITYMTHILQHLVTVHTYVNHNRTFYNTEFSQSPKTNAQKGPDPS